MLYCKFNFAYVLLIHRETYTVYRQADGQMKRQIDKQTNRQMDRKTDRQKGRAASPL
jgi:hypothetical protein